MPHNAVIFDLFGTLVDNWPAEERKALLAAMAAELDVPYDGLYRVWDEHRHARDTGAFSTVVDAVTAACQALDAPIEGQRVASAAALYSDFAGRCLAPREDAVETMRALRERGYRIGLISDCGPPTPELWSRSALAPWFHVTTFSCVAALKKPDPRIYHVTCEALQVEPRHCLYVGDGGSRELTGAETVGMRALMIRTPSEDIIAPLRVDADSWTGTRIRSLGEVLAHLE